MALRHSENADTIKTIRLNRALAYLKREEYEAALTDTGYFNTPPERSEKAVYRAGLALSGLRRYQECYNCFVTFVQLFPEHPQGEIQFKRATRLLAESKTGQYDFDAIRTELHNTNPPLLDHATFVGPVEIKSSVGRGEGLFTTRDVRAGELLFCEKAFVYRYAGTDDRTESKTELTILLESYSNKVTMGTQADLIVDIIQKLERNPSLRTSFARLHHGSYCPLPDSPQGNQAIDT